MSHTASLKESKGQFLPPFTPQQQQLVKGSLDFIAVAAFTSRWVSAVPGHSSGWAESKAGPDGRLIGPATGVTWMNVVPSSQANTLRYLAKRYGGVPLLISSSGTQEPGEGRPGSKALVNDAFRLDYYKHYLNSVCEAASSGEVQLLAWYAWSLFTGVEPDGTVFGVVDATPTTRTPKASARWLSQNFWKPSA
jgi:beta-glucosidase